MISSYIPSSVTKIISILILFIFYRMTPLDMNDNLKNKFKQAFVKNAALPPARTRKNRTPFFILIIVACLIIGLQYSSSIFSPDPETDSWGKIISPAAGSTTGAKVRIVGETQDIGTGQYIWISVDKPDIGHCWPKKQVLRNTRFATAILVERPDEPFYVSLYILNETLHSQWKDWQDKEIFSGLPMPLENRRLDQINLVLKK